MEALLFRTGSGSIPVHSSFTPASPRLSASLPVQESEKTGVSSPRISLHLEVNRRGIRRSSSESDVIRSEIDGRMLSRLGSSSFPAGIPEEENATEDIDPAFLGGIGSLTLTEDFKRYAGDLPRVPLEELGYSGGGTGKSRNYGGGDEDGSGGFDGGRGDRSKIGAYYLETLKSNPTNSLLLANYAKYLHEVERDTTKAEEYCGRAILASPGDGEVLSLYGKLIWEGQKDGNRAKSYFDQAVHASPDDCMVLGSYAHFMWEAEDEDEEEEAEITTTPKAMVEAF